MDETILLETIKITDAIVLDKSHGFALVFLLMVWAQLLFGGMMVGRTDKLRTRRMPVWTRMGSSFLLVIAAWILFSFLPAPDDFLMVVPTDQIYDYVRYIAIGMTLGFIGDLFMANLIRIRQVDHVLAGMLAFGLGHIAYILGMLDLIDTFLPDDNRLVQLSIALWWSIAAVLWFMLIFRPAEEKSVLHYAALPYALLLATTTALACAIALDHPEFTLVALGTILFLTSDLILAMHLFNKAYFPLIDDVVWLTYGPGQMLIVYGIALFELRLVPRIFGM